MRRREWLASTVGALAAAGCRASVPRSSGGMVDAHVHFYDPSRSGGVPWPPANDPVLYRTVLPEHLRALAEPLGVVGAIAVEASPLEQDNHWLLEWADRDPFVLGVVGHLKPGRAGFAEELGRLAEHPKFLGMRTGLWNVEPSLDETVLADLRRVASRGLSLDLGQGAARLAIVPALARALPNLRIVVNHLGGPVIRAGEGPPAEWRQAVRAAAAQRNVAMKISGFVEALGRGMGGGPVKPEPDAVRPWFDELLGVFGPDRLIFATNWPVCEKQASYAEVVELARGLTGGLSESERESILRTSALRWYRRR